MEGTTWEDHGKTMGIGRPAEMTIVVLARNNGSEWSAGISDGKQ